MRKWASLFTAITALLGVGCPRDKPQMPTLIAPLGKVMFREPVDGPFVGQDQLESKKRYHLYVAGQGNGSALVLGHNSGGGLFAVSDIIDVVPEKTIQFTVGDNAYEFDNQLVVPGGPAYVVFGARRDDLEQLVQYLQQGGDWRQVKEKAIVIPRSS